MQNPSTTNYLFRYRYLLLGTAMVITALLSLGVHTVMLDVLHIPYPENYPSTGWPVYLGNFLYAFTVIYLYRLIFPKWRHLCSLLQGLGLFLLMAMLNEDLLRAPLMNAIVTSAWLFSFTQNLSKLLPHLLFAYCAALSAPHFKHLWQIIVAALLLALFWHLVCQPWLSSKINIVLEHLPQPKSENIILPPYGLNVLLPAYLTFIEPVIASFIIANLVWDKLPPSFSKQLGHFIVLILFARQIVIPTFVYPLYSPFPTLTALLSIGQFFLETLVLALLTALICRYYCYRSALN